MYWNAYGKMSIRGDLRLIETWDVLKYSNLPILPRVLNRLIETWDVLKFFRGLDKEQKTKD